MEKKSGDKAAVPPVIIYFVSLKTI